MNYPNFPCPKCKRSLPPIGELAVDADTFPMYQCDDCIVDTMLFGAPMQLPYTFYVGADGAPVDAKDLAAEH